MASESPNFRRDSPPARSNSHTKQENPQRNPDNLLSNVAAIVVTHRRPTLATQVVSALINDEGVPASQVFVVVNGEGGLSDQILATTVNLIQLQDNIGPAGGFREGILAADRQGSYDWFYLCEDDVGLFALPPNRLNRLLTDMLESRLSERYSPLGAVVAYGRDLHPISGHTTVHVATNLDGYDVVDAASWGATLLHRRVLDADILPVDDYFFGYEDFDFFYQITRNGFKILLDNRSATSVAKQMSGEGRDEAFRGKRPLDQEEPWRAFYVARNFFLLASRHGSPAWILAHLLYSLRRVQLASSRAEQIAILKGLYAGLLGKQGKDDRFVRTSGENTSNPQVRSASSVVPRDATGCRRVLHVVPTDLARGAQVALRDLKRLLSSEHDRHEILTIFSSESIFLESDYPLRTPITWRRRIGFDPVAYFRLRTALHQIRPDIVVAHGGEPLKYLVPITFQWCPLVYYAFGIVTANAHRGFRHLLYRRLMNRADIVAGISTETLEEARDLFGVSPERLVRLPNARPPEVYYQRRHSLPEARPIKLIYVGHLTATKRPLIFLDLVTELRRRGFDVIGDMVGDGPLEEKVRRQAVGTEVNVLGRRTDVPNILRDADIFVFTSIPESEGMPGVLIEAGMCGLPIVATDCPGVSSIVDHGRTGLIVGVNDFGGMVEALQRLLEDDDVRSRMGAAAAKWCVQNFSLQASKELWLQALDRLVPL